MNQEIFCQPYERENFFTFLRSFLPEDINLQEEDFVTDTKYKTIIKAHRIGTVESLDLSIIEVTHNTGDARVAISTDAFKMMADHWIHRALIIFKNDTGNYRFSLLTIDLDEDSRGKLVHHYSSPRRYSFFLGEDAKVNTPYLQLIKKGAVKDFEDLQSRFSLEVVNKAFYAELVGFFDDLVKKETGTMKMPGEQTDELQKNFAVRLIGRIIFTWFLKQKKSPQGQLVPDGILSSRAVTAQKYVGGYYHDRLERLFFELLNKPLHERDIHGEMFDLVPYLNGGLFTPHKDDFYDLDKATATSKYINTLHISDDWFQKFFTFLETYNFTIDENTSFDQELSIDPEMLGRIFENLLAEIDEDTGTSARKATGSFYTPREIVDYMVDASLLEYFKTKTDLDEKKLKAMISYDRDDDKEHPLSNSETEKIIDAISALKTLDPACGSGAFPIGMLQKLVYILHVIDEDGTRWRNKKLKDIPEIYRQKIEVELRAQSKDYIRKLEVIKNSIFGVDIQPIAVEVSRLRAFLTLIVEEEIDDKRPNRGIEPLPNLEFKFVCANSLIPAPEQEDPEQQLFVDDFQDQLKTEIDKYFSATGHEKASYLGQIRNLIDEKIKGELKTIQSMFRHDDEEMQRVLAKKNEKVISTQVKMMELWESYKNLFENKPVGFFETEYFFPSVEEGFDIVIGNPPYFVYEGANSTDELPIIKSISLYNDAKSGKLNAYKLFLLRSSNMINNKGILCEIFQNSFLADNSAKGIRKFFLDKQQIIRIDSFPERDNVNKRVFYGVKMSVCILISKNYQRHDYKFPLNIWEDKNKTNGFQTIFSKQDIKDFDSNGYSIPSIKEREKMLFNKLFSKEFKRVRNVCKSCYRGELNMTTERKYFTSIPNGALALKGAQIQKFFYTMSPSQGKIEYVSKENYLNEKTGEKTKHHMNDRIVMQRITGVDEKFRIKATIVKSGNFCADSCNYISSSELNGISMNILLAILNSNIFNWTFKKTSTNSNVNSYEIENIPIPQITPANQPIATQIESLVDQILTIKKENPKADTIDLENQIDELVFDLYGLTEEEREVVLGS